MKKASLIIPFLLVGLMTQAQEKPLHEIHAAMLFNFLKYIQWPNEADGGEFVVGVMGEDNVFNTLKGWYDGKPKGTKKYVIKKLSSAADASGCSVVYLGKSKSREFEDIKGAVAGRAVLTITDSFNLGQKGSCINFKVIDGKLKFELNQGSVSAANLKVSSQLASMAIII
ncbi:MAG: YfiR family protein [Cyclobacteriaceae bacterium]